MVVERSPHPDGRVFLCCSGSEAVDTALKIARLWHRLRGDNERQAVIRRTNGYHGTNFGGTTAQGIAPNREGWGDLVPHFTEVPHDDLGGRRRGDGRPGGTHGRGDLRAVAGGRRRVAAG